LRVVGDVNLSNVYRGKDVGVHLEVRERYERGTREVREVREVRYLTTVDTIERHDLTTEKTNANNKKVNNGTTCKEKCATSSYRFTGVQH
jgi:hypothetical protein